EPVCWALGLVQAKSDALAATARAIRSLTCIATPSGIEPCRNYSGARRQSTSNAEAAETAEKKSSVNLCGLCDLCVRTLQLSRFESREDARRPERHPPQPNAGRVVDGVGDRGDHRLARRLA